MDISKIQFGQLSQSKDIEKSFEDLDVNNDGVINEKDTAAATNKALSAEITNLLNEVDNDTDVEILGDFVDDTNAVKSSAKAGSASSVGDVNSVTATDSVNEVSSVNSATSTTSTSNKKEVKTMAEYKEILDCKFNELWDKYGNAESCIQYMKNNLGSFMDVTGDGRVDKIDLQILDNYLKLLPKCSSSDPVEQQKGRAYTKGINDFTQELRKQTYVSTSSLNDTNSYTLEDVENYVKLGGKPAMLRRNLDIASIAQDCNWRERLLVAGLPESDLRTTGEVYKQVTAAQEFIKNNPDKIGYAGLAGVYKLVSGQYGHLTGMDAWCRAEERYDSRWHISGQHFYNSFFTPYIINSAMFDINGDGKFDSTDLISFSTSMDLDGDGIVSKEESTFLSNAKEKMKEIMYKDITCKSLQNNVSIDDIITYYDTFGENADTSEKLSEALAKFENMKTNDKLYNTDPQTGIKGLTGIALHSLLSSMSPACTIATKVGLLDGTDAIITDPREVHRHAIPDDEVTSIITQAINQASPANTFLHYVQSADLSKDELQSILSKINGSSIPTQYKLAEVKKVVETKLAGLK